MLVFYSGLSNIQVFGCVYLQNNNYEYYIFWMAHDNQLVQLVIVYFVAKPNYEKEIPTKKEKKNRTALP